MKRTALVHGAALALFLTIALQPQSAHACAMCMGGADSHNGQALNGAIFFMLGMLGVVFAGVGGVVYSMVRRARNPLPPHVQLVASLPEDAPEFTESIS